MVYDKAFGFAVRIVKLHKYLADEKKEYVLAKQILRSGTSIGANISEAKEGLSKKEFRAKMSIALKEASETRYWLNLLHATCYIEDNMHKSLLKDVEELIKILVAIVKNSEQTNGKQTN